MAGERHVSDARPSGLLVGQSSTDKIAFYGGTPIVKASVAAAMTATSTTTQLETTLDAIGTALHNLGLITYTT